jgi:hypothetical protein
VRHALTRGLSAAGRAMCGSDQQTQVGSMIQTPSFRATPGWPVIAGWVRGVGSDGGVRARVAARLGSHTTLQPGGARVAWHQCMQLHGYRQEDVGMTTHVSVGNHTTVLQVKGVRLVVTPSIHN